MAHHCCYFGKILSLLKNLYEKSYGTSTYLSLLINPLSYGKLPIWKDYLFLVLKCTLLWLCFGPDLTDLNLTAPIPNAYAICTYYIIQAYSKGQINFGTEY